MRRIFASVVLLATLSGCNTFVEKTFQEVHVSTPGVEGAECFLETEKQKYVAITPQTILVERAPYNMLVTCQKAYYHDAVEKIDYKIKPWYGLMFPPGLIYDVADNSVYAYPKHIQIQMTEDDQALRNLQEQFTAPVSEVQKKKRPEFEMSEPVMTPKGAQTFDNALHK